MPVVLALIVALGCVAAAARRLAYAAAPSRLDPRLLARYVDGPDADDARRDARARALVAAFGREPEGSWERELADALGETDHARLVFVDAARQEAAFLAGRWARVPRVCASVATSACFLLASLVIRRGLEAMADGDAAATSTAIVFRALDVVTLGMAAAAFCVAIQARARLLAREAVRAAEALCDRLEAVASPSGDLGATDGGVGACAPTSAPGREAYPAVGPALS